ncbi:PA0069 family radical SAM protein [Azohydromonas lata]|uniref:PA0069 family radical SAM protein n=1 Tax=Azohydromonas lata TaxID=45677 RepID=A0ABU5IK01_9BURK|nr:PA0069 family radical SAM protein [Azohydromonas lata]MDZ5459223.1 PA0069 family radical SAM protein [Azohydromonas lata]
MRTAQPPDAAAHAPGVAPVHFVPFKGRGASRNIASRFEAVDREGFDDGWGTLAQAALQERAAPRTQIIEQSARSILAGNDSPDIPFDLSINPYRGCEHGCIYCFARPTHSYLDLSPGLDFETRIVAKTNAAQKLREAFASPSYEPSLLSLGSATDAYQPAERQLRITRGLIEVLAEHRHAFSIVTKSSGIERDLDLIAPMAAQRLAAVYVSITTLDAKLARLMEPRATAPARRLRTMETLARAGVPVGVSVSPLIPLLNEPELERILEAARDAGASRAFSIALRLPWEVNPLFQQWLHQHFPQRAAHVMARMRELRGGRENDSRFGHRMRGQGVWGELLSQRLHKACARLGLNLQPLALDLSQFQRPVPVACGAAAPAAPRPAVQAAGVSEPAAGVQGELF